MKDLIPLEAQSLIEDQNSQDFFIIDVRTLEEFEEGHIPGAILKTYGTDFKLNIKNFNKSGVYLIYCQSGVRSLKAAQEMDKLGFKNLNTLSGGFLAWNVEGLPISIPIRKN